MKSQIILLTGPKHSGKTEAGRALAASGGRTFVDVDELVEKRTGKTPRTLFKEGPEVFRKAEAEALAEILQAGGATVAAAGGGLIDNLKALELLKRSPAPCIVYLEVSAETAWNRIVKTAAGGELPPFLNTENPRETHRELHQRRARAYRAMAGIIVNAGDKSPGAIAEEILKVTEKAEGSCGDGPASGGEPDRNPSR
jgi:shikimate kinase